MKDAFLKIVGKIFSRPLAVRCLMLYSGLRGGISNIYDLDGSLYMGRWRIVDEGTWQSTVLMKLTGYASIRLHHIMRKDHDRDMHDHPFRYRTFVLDGMYTEAYQVDCGFRKGIHIAARCVLAGETAASVHPGFHRITSVSKGGVWTLFCMTTNTGEWGFLVDGTYVESKPYLADLGYRNGGKGEAA